MAAILHHCCSYMDGDVSAKDGDAVLQGDDEIAFGKAACIYIFVTVLMLIISSKLFPSASSQGLFGGGGGGGLFGGGGGGGLFGGGGGGSSGGYSSGGSDSHGNGWSSSQGSSGGSGGGLGGIFQSLTSGFGSAFRTKMQLFQRLLSGFGNLGRGLGGLLGGGRNNAGGGGSGGGYANSVSTGGDSYLQSHQATSGWSQNQGGGSSNLPTVRPSYGPPPSTQQQAPTGTVSNSYGPPSALSSSYGAPSASSTAGTTQSPRNARSDASLYSHL